MADPQPFQHAVRSLLRDRILDAASGLAEQNGWARVRMADVATGAGVSRQTLYNEFGSKPALAEALVIRETEMFLAGIRVQLDAHVGDPHEALAAAVRFTLDAAGENALLKAILTRTDDAGDALLPLLTTRSAPILGTATDMFVAYAREHWHDLRLNDDELRFLMDTIVRLTVSHIVMPLAPPAKTARRVRWLVTRALAHSIA